MTRRRSVLLGGVLGGAALLGTGASLLAARGLAVVLSYHRREAYWARRATAAGELRYVALGDSLAQGIGASRPELGYVGLLADEVARRTGSTVQVVNLSRTGATVADVRAEQLPRLAGLAPDLVTMGVGSNDAGRTPIAEFRRRFAALCAALPAGTLVADVPDFQGGPRLQAAQELSRVAREVLAEHPRLIPVALEAATHGFGFGDYSGDFFHPGDAGYRRYGAAFVVALDRRQAGRR